MKFLMAGSRGQAKDLIGAFRYEPYISEITLFDDVGAPDKHSPFETIPMLHTISEASHYFNQVSRFFIVAIASPQKRREVAEKLIEAGGRPFTYLGSRSNISTHSSISENGVVIQMSCEVGCGVTLEEGVLINIQSTIGNDVRIGAYSTIAPDVVIMHNVSIGRNCIISTGVTITPGVTIGDNVKVWMGKTVTSHLPSNSNFI